MESTTVNTATVSWFSVLPEDIQDRAMGSISPEVCLLNIPLLATYKEDECSSRMNSPVCEEGSASFHHSLHCRSLH